MGNTLGIVLKYSIAGVSIARRLASDSAKLRLHREYRGGQRRGPEVNNNGRGFEDQASTLGPSSGPANFGQLPAAPRRATPRKTLFRWEGIPRTGSLYLQQQRQRTVHGEELPYVLGLPLDGNKYDLRRRYNIGETLFSEAMMNWWCSFAYVG